jgi:transcriptional accessory protein Tex/SPT6
VVNKDNNTIWSLIPQAELKKLARKTGVTLKAIGNTTAFGV